LLVAVSEQVKMLIAHELPLRPTATEVTALLGPWAAGAHPVDTDLLGRALIAPLRSIVDRGGKAWRSFAMIESLAAVGGDPGPFVPWLLVPELIHVGSLIIDDVQDASEVRRGGPACHRAFGVPLAVNAGTAAYFLAELFLRRVPVAPDVGARISRIYFEAMRCGHAGQALDILGLVDALDGVVRSGDAGGLVQRLLAISRLKTGVPARAAAQMGAAAGGATEQQMEEVGAYFETVGVAFQIVDDVLNLSGFRSNRKERGEDLREGKVTLPVAVAFGRLEASQRAALVRPLQEASRMPADVENAIRIVEASGALTTCLEDARRMIEEGWSRLEPHLPESRHKRRLEAFGRFVIDRSD
jgi:geranylgeranyl pyrophosphate synthase